VEQEAFLEAVAAEQAIAELRMGVWADAAKLGFGPFR
jgi:hypothetical protein